MSDAGLLMDRMYRRQRHIYDATRKYYLLGRDGAIAALAPLPGETVLEIGCGTGRNLISVARRFPSAAVYGLDVSSAMLATAHAAIDRAGLGGRVMLAQDGRQRTMTLSPGAHVDGRRVQIGAGSRVLRRRPLGEPHREHP